MQGVDWYGASWSSGKPVPVLERGGELFGLACAEHDQLEAALAAPIDPKAFASLMYTLQGHFWQPGMDAALARAVAQDYARHLGQFPLVAVQAAYDACLLNPEIKFFPKIAELNQAIKQEVATINLKLTKLRALIANAG